MSFDSPMFVSSPDVFSSKFKSKEFVDIDLMEDSSSASAGEYASDIFSYLKEAEVRIKKMVGVKLLLHAQLCH